MKYQQEFLATVKDDIRPLIQKHWEDIALNKDKIKLNPDWDAYHDLEQKGMLKAFTAREGDKLVGYFVVVVQRNLHYKDHLFASTSSASVSVGVCPVAFSPCRTTRIL